MINWTHWNRGVYAVWAPFYDVLVRMLEEKRRYALQLASLNGGEKVLIIGAGTGLDLPYLPPDCEITAVDITPAMTKRLVQRADKLGLRVDCRIMDAQCLDIPDESFDVVILHFVLAVIPDPTRAIQEAARVLKPAGRVIILNKFVPDDSRPSKLTRFVNLGVRLVATDITCSLGPLVTASGLQRKHEETLGVGGFFKVAILEKGAPAKVIPYPEQTMEVTEKAAEATVRKGHSAADEALTGS